MDFLLVIKRCYWAVWRERWRLSPSRHYEHFMETRFDHKFGLDTVARVPLSALRIDSGNRAFGRVYAGSPIAQVRRGLRQLDVRSEEFTFIDLGSGKGRVLLLASELGFRRIVGVEFAPELHAIAQRNIGRYPPCAGRDVRSLCVDAGNFPIPAESCVVYLYRPFGLPVVELVARNIAAAVAAGAARIVVVYLWPIERQPFDRDPRFRLRQSGPTLAVYDALEADFCTDDRARHQS